ncbi:YbaK/EbsC family protein [Intestinibacillus massiliensis]|uniref:YbaK/EbsC family protein n=1 Tax=Intestinibacillus massiliensis TaxID=1871029 RepID=UPI000B357B78|nr:YbaK/EbsC family protein [Intestinibacillus massiliensis]
MSYQQVKAYLNDMGLADHITEHNQTGDTVEHAAETIGCTPAEIAKALSFLVDGKPVMVVMAGDTKVNSSKFKSFFHQKPSMIPYEQVEELIGHAPGGVCPFAVNEGVPVYLDASLKRFAVIYTAAGTDMATIRLTMPELETYSHSVGWVDVCKGWFANEVGLGA